MTSKNLFFNLIKEDVKRRTWVIALNALAMFFTLPIATALMAGSDTWYTEDRLEQLARMTRTMTEWFSAENYLMVFLVWVFAVLCSFSGFAYMNSRKKVDFYHSLPVKRGMLFSVYYLNGILMFVSVYLVNLLIALGIAAVNGADMAKVMPAAWIGLGVHVTGFLIMYSTVTVAVLMTGNIVIGFLGTGVFFAYCPALALIVRGLFSTWFRTYGYFSPYTGTDWFDLIMNRCSPVAAYLNMVSVVSWDGGGLAGMMAGTVAAAAVLTGISLVLHKLRPSESCGKAMAFKKTEPVIRILLVIPMALTGSLIFWSIRDSFGWSVFGALCIGVIAHCIIEIIYHFDFRKLFAHAVQMGICMAVSLLILFTFKFDLLGYDTYKPNPSSVESVAVEIGRIDDWVTYGETLMTGCEEEENLSYRWSYGSTEDFIYNHMKVTEFDEVTKLVDAGIARNNRIKSGQVSEYREDEGVWYAPVNVLYQLKNGRRVGRSYYMPLGMEKEAFESLYKKPEYKVGVFPILSQLPEETAGAYYQEQDDISQLEIGKDYGKEAELTELLKAYQEDLKSLSIEDRIQGSPIGMVQFMDQDQYNAVTYLKSHKRSSAYDLEQRCYYPVYPSFTKTIELLKQYGVTPGAHITADQVDKLVITDNRSSAEAEYVYDGYAEEVENRIYIFTEKDQIEAIMTAIIPYDYADMNVFNPTDYYSDVKVTVGTGPKREEYSYRLDVDRMPEFLKQAMNFNSTRKDVEYDW